MVAIRLAPDQLGSSVGRIVARVRSRLAMVVALCLVAGAVVTVARAGTPRPILRSGGNARVRGRFQMRGVITRAVDVTGERRGEHVRRTWAIHPAGCARNVCRRLQVVRNRGRIRNSYVVLHRVGKGRYRGSGVFWVALKCLGHRYRLGSRVPYTITLQVARRERVGSVWYATSIRATYANRSRTDATRCPLGPASDAARYVGRLASRLPVPPYSIAHSSKSGTTTTPATTT
jgi:hypothetical protein